MMTMYRRYSCMRVPMECHGMICVGYERKSAWLINCVCAGAEVEEQTTEINYLRSLHLSKSKRLIVNLMIAHVYDFYRSRCAYLQSALLFKRKPQVLSRGQATSMPITNHLPQCIFSSLSCSFPLYPPI